MQHFRPALFLWVILLFVSSTSAGVITPDLQRLLDTTDENTYVPVVIELVEQADIQILDQQLRDRQASLTERRQIVVETLKETAQQTQPALTPLLNDAVESGLIHHYETYWIINAIYAEATKTAIVQIAQHDHVAFLHLVPDLKLIDPVRKKAALRSPGGTEPGLRAINADQVWHLLGITGAGRITANIDTGVDGSHPALYHSWRGNNGYPADQCWYGPGDFPVDSEDHGTHVMGIQCGLETETSDTIGVAWAAQWIAAQWGGSMIPHFEWIADPNGGTPPDVVNNSWHQGEFCGSGQYLYPAIDNCEAAGVVVLWAAGNDGPDPQTITPNASRVTTPLKAFSVGATGTSPPYHIAGFSSRGPSICDYISIKPEVSAPGVSIRSCVPDSGYARFDGTSMACPHVAGTVTLMREANPDMGVDEIKEAIINSCVDLGDIGEDNDYGHGFIDAFVAVGRYAMSLPNLTLLAVNVHDSTGNADGRPDPGETVEVTIPLFNFWDGEAIEPIVELIVDHPAIQMETGIVTYPNIPPDQFIENMDDPFIFSVPEDVEGETIPFVLRVTTTDNPLVYELPFELVIGRPEILVVDDDNGAAYELYYQAALDSIHAKYEFWTTDLQGVPGDAQFAHDIIIWYTGDAGQTTLDADEQAFLTTFLDNGGRLFITGQDIGRDLVLEGNGEDFYRDYLRAELIEDNYQGLVVLRGIEGDCLSETWDLVVAMGQGGANNQESPSIIAPAEDRESIPILNYGQGTDAGAIKYAGEYQLIYFAFGFEAVYETAGGSFAPDSLMNDILEWLRYPCDITPVEAEIPTTQTPASITLQQNYPNPFNPKTMIHYTLPKTNQITLRVYHTNGQLVKTLVNQEQPAGDYTIQWNGTNEMGKFIESGVYFYTLQTEETTQTRRMVLLK